MELYAAANQNNLKKCKNLLRHRKFKNAARYGFIGACEGHLPLVKYFLNRFKINDVDYIIGISASARHGNLEIYNFLNNYRRPQNNLFYKTLYLAIVGNNKEIIQHAFNQFLSTGQKLSPQSALLLFAKSFEMKNQNMMQFISEKFFKNMGHSMGLLGVTVAFSDEIKADFLLKMVMEEKFDTNIFNYLSLFLGINGSVKLVEKYKDQTHFNFYYCFVGAVRYNQTNLVKYLCQNNHVSEKAVKYALCSLVIPQTVEKIKCIIECRKHKENILFKTAEFITLLNFGLSPKFLENFKMYEMKRNKRVKFIKTHLVNYVCDDVVTIIGSFVEFV